MKTKHVLATMLLALICNTEKSLGQVPRGNIQAATLTGRCVKVIVASKKATGECAPSKDKAVIMNTISQDGRSTFYVVTDQHAIAFSGTGSIQTSENSSMQPIDAIFLTRIGEKNSETIRAIGGCKYENPTMGVPTQIQCSANTKQGIFALEFLHDGRPPKFSSR